MSQEKPVLLRADGAKRSAPSHSPQERDGTVMSFPLVLARVGADFTVTKAPCQCRHFRVVEQRQHRDGRRWGFLEEREKPPAWKPFCSSWRSLVQAAGWGGKARWGLDTEPPGADVPASLKMSSSTWICLRLSPVAQAGAYPYTG